MNINKKYIIMFTIFICAVVIATVGILAAISKNQNGSNWASAPGIVILDENTQIAGSAYSDGEGMESNDSVDDENSMSSDYYIMQLKTYAKSYDGKNFDCSIANAEENNMKVYVTIEIDEKVIYSSPILELGEKLREFSVVHELERGEYNAVLKYHEIKDAQGTEAFSVATKYILYVE